MDNDQSQEVMLDPEDVCIIEAALERGYNAHRLSHGECPLLSEVFPV